jgi:hypothetical protein
MARSCSSRFTLIAAALSRNRIILANVADYAMELGLLDANPIRAIKWAAPKVSSQGDRRSVVNPRQARALLDARPAAKRASARHLLRGDVLSRAPPGRGH